ncbi:hypothetical protein BDA96_09G134500 [Sorghum bicolor]|uniref:Ribosomal protein eL8/eL30/eS12/Gadd45 domain-containing protein n=2 Tax=Sorghum bicolor TaxID=4558 RepID=A0A1B6P840_SORBI|nr:hypothetical protein BDA96_09G134500 [Sorghum bicolor]KXG21929.1 hypothetical protein SORBI_3009G127700 [Sorghum bicolor]
MGALQLIMKKSGAHDGLVKGLSEAAKAIEEHAAQLSVLVKDCDQPDYVKLVKALWLTTMFTWLLCLALKLLAGGLGWTLWPSRKKNDTPS